MSRIARSKHRLFIVVFILAWSGVAGAAPANDFIAKDGPALFGIPVDFILFALTLLGVALFHRHTLRVALTGLAVILGYKFLLVGFKYGSGFAGFVSHMGHEWVILTNLFLLLVGFALLSSATACGASFLRVAMRSSPKLACC